MLISCEFIDAYKSIAVPIHQFGESNAGLPAAMMVCDSFQPYVHTGNCFKLIAIVAEGGTFIRPAHNSMELKPQPVLMYENRRFPNPSLVDRHAIRHIGCPALTWMSARLEWISEITAWPTFMATRPCTDF